MSFCFQQRRTICHTGALWIAGTNTTKMALLYPASIVGIPRRTRKLLPSSSFTTTTTHKDKCNICSFVSSAMSSCSTTSYSGQSKRVWIWTENKQVMTAAVERGWNTFIFSPDSRQLSDDWSSIAVMCPLYVEEGGIFDGEKRRVGSIFGISNPQELELLQHEKGLGENVVVDLLDWQVIPAENIVAAFQGSEKTVFAVSKSASEAQLFLEALEQGLGGVVLKVEDAKAVLELKEYFDRRNDMSNILSLTKATVTRVQVVGMGDRVCVDLCSIMRPGEGLLGPVHAYVAIPGGKTCYLSELKAGKEVIVVDQNGQQRNAIVGRVKIETRPLILVEAKLGSNDQTLYSIILQNAETVALVSPCQGNGLPNAAIPVTSLKVGVEVFLRLQGGARHTGIEIQEFIVEN